MHNGPWQINPRCSVANLCANGSLSTKTYQSQRKDDQHECELYQQILHLKDPA